MLDGVVLARKTGAGALRRPVLVALGRSMPRRLLSVFDGIPVQRCWTHKIRNVLDKGKKADQRAAKPDGALPGLESLAQLAKAIDVTWLAFVGLGLALNDKASSPLPCTASSKRRFHSACAFSVRSSRCLMQNRTTSQSSAEGASLVVAISSSA
jgi:hypothetical protein